jgi:hypothetical protein
MEVMQMKKMWCRVGVSINITDRNYDKFVKAYKEDKAQAYEMLKLLLASGYAGLDGETYFPDNVDDNINMEFNF